LQFCNGWGATIVVRTSLQKDDPFCAASDRPALQFPRRGHGWVWQNTSPVLRCLGYHPGAKIGRSDRRCRPLRAESAAGRGNVRWGLSGAQSQRPDGVATGFGRAGWPAAMAARSRVRADGSRAWCSRDFSRLECWTAGSPRYGLPPSAASRPQFHKKRPAAGQHRPTTGPIGYAAF
jgi:hypothetical protein